MINVAYVFDENFSDATLVSILSCIENNQEELAFHLVTFQDNTHNLELINKEIALKNHRSQNYMIDVEKVNWGLGRMGARNKSLANAPFSNATYLKILIPDLVKEDKVIFIDSDTLVGTCLRDLWENKIKGKMIAGVFNDGMSNFLKDEEDVFGYKNDDYINAGVLLMDLEQLRQIKFVSKCQVAYQEFATQIQFNDQDLINFTLKTDKFLLPVRFNTFAKFTESKAIVDKKIEDLKNSILHFIGDVKPWQSWNIPPFCDLWMQYAKLATTKKIELTPITNLAQIIKQGQLLHAYGDYQAASLVKTKTISVLMRELNQK